MATYSSALDLLILAGESELEQLGLDTAEQEVYASTSEAVKIVDGETLATTPSPETTLLASRLSQAIEHAQGRVAAYVEGRYPALAYVPAALRDAATAIARHRLHLRRDAEMVPTVGMAYEDAVDFLRAIASGKATLPAAPGSSAASAGRARRGIADTSLVEMRGLVL